MTDELRLHWQLHVIDEQAVRLESERARLPEIRRAAESRVAADRRRLEVGEKSAAASQARRRALEGEIAVLESQERKYRATLDAVTNQQQFEAVQHQISGVAAKRSELETAALTCMDDEERLAAEHPALADALARSEAEAATILGRAAEDDARLAAALAALDVRRSGAVAPLEPAARTRYERTRTSRAGRAVAAIEKDACGACFRALSPHALQEARRRDKLLVCDGCGRLMMLAPGDDTAA